MPMLPAWPVPCDASILLRIYVMSPPEVSTVSRPDRESVKYFSGPRAVVPFSGGGGVGNGSSTVHPRSLHVPAAQPGMAAPAAATRIETRAKLPS
jgi:hypothetical protein